MLERGLLLSSISLSIPTGLNAIQNGIVSVPIMAADLNDEEGDTGLSQATFCVNYNSSKLSVSNTFVYQGTDGQEAASMLNLIGSNENGQMLIELTPEVFSISSVAGTGGPIQVTTSNPVPEGLKSDVLEISISGVSGFPAANGLFFINKVTGTHTFTLDNTNGEEGSGTGGSLSPVISGGTAGDTGGSNNGSVAVINFNVLSSAATGITNINLVGSNSMGTTSVIAADGVGMPLSFGNGSVNILPESDTTNLGYFNSVTPLTLGGSPGIGTMTTLSDGDILAQGGNNNASDEWFELAPDGSGSYDDGSWYQLADSNVGRLYYGSALLPSGQLMVLGGEDTDSNDGSAHEVNTGEIFTPPTTLGGSGSWATITPYPETNFGDDNLEVLNSGTVLAGGNDDGKSYVYNPSLDPILNPSLPSSDNPWTPDATLPANDSNAETTWTKLPDGNIVSYNLNGYSDSSPQTATRLVFGATQSADQWVSAGNVPIPLGGTGGSGDVEELGAAFLLPDGDVWQIGSNGNTAIYTPPALAGNSTGNWTMGPVVPNGMGATDAPGAMMRNGDVLFAVSPYMDNNFGNGFVAVTQIDEYDPTTNTISVVPLQNSGGTLISSLSNTLAGTYCYFCRMVVLPNGNVMITDGGNDA